MYMMEGLDGSFDAAMFLGYHGPIGASSVLSHSYNPRVIWEVRIDGEVTGETGLNALVAHYYGVPVIMISGDDHTIEDAKNWIPEATGVAVKSSVTRFAANSLTAERARELIFQSAQAVVAQLPECPPDKPVTIDITFQSEDMATLAEWTDGVERTGMRSIRFKRENGLQAYRSFVVLLFLARNAADSH